MELSVGSTANIPDKERLSASIAAKTQTTFHKVISHERKVIVIESTSEGNITSAKNVAIFYGPDRVIFAKKWRIDCISDGPR